MFPNRIFSVRLFLCGTLTSLLCLSALAIMCIIFQAQNSFAAQITLQWDDNNEPGLVSGYYVYCGASTGNYQITRNVGNQTSCTFSDLPEGVVYHIAVKAYSTSTGVLSQYSEELVYLAPTGIGFTTDTDEDGIIDYYEINVYHTEPHLADTDHDGLNDGEELIFWGNNWNHDDDNDSLTNLLDNDSDNDGYTDGSEIKNGSNPSDNRSIPYTSSTPGEVAHWRFNEGSGQSTADSSSVGCTGILVNDPDWVFHGAGDPALHFDGIQSYVDTGFDLHLPNWTVSVWVKGDHSPDSTQDTGPIMKQQNYMITWDHTNTAYSGAAVVCVNGNWYAASFGALKPHVWYYLTVTYDGETLRAYKDGLLITENPDPSGPSDDSFYTAKIGRHAVLDRYFAGTVDDVRIYDHALNENEVAVLYEEEKYLKIAKIIDRLTLFFGWDIIENGGYK